jgi:pimeloyl-ACP methyl ester carboxylesterase
MSIAAPLAWLGLAMLCVTLIEEGCSRPSTQADASHSTEPFGALTVRAPDAFYDQPTTVPAQPGALLKSERLKNVTLPSGMRGWRIFYTTTVDDHTPATAVATVFAPIDPPPSPRPVITWTHGSTGLVQRCMPSLASAPSEGIPARDRIVAAGWVIVATDYSFAEKGGPHPYLIGAAEARAALDSVRAARQMPELTLDPRTVVWGYSQGGQAALWAGIIGQRYAPDVPIVGIAAIAPAANMKAILEMNMAADKHLGAYLAAAYSRFYPDIRFEQAVRPEALNAAREMTGLCGYLPPKDTRRISKLAASFDGRVLAMSTNAALSARLDENTANHPIAAPVVIAQGMADAVVPPLVTDAYVDERCNAGQRLEYWTFFGRDHGTIVQPGTPLEEPLIEWTSARFAGEPNASGCKRKNF